MLGAAEETGEPELPGDGGTPEVPAASDGELTRLWGEVEQRFEDMSRLDLAARARYRVAVIERLRERCREGDLSIGLDAIRLVRMGSFLGVSDTAEERQHGEALDLIARCSRFEVDFESVISNGAPTAEFLYHVRAKVPVNATPGAGVWRVDFDTAAPPVLKGWSLAEKGHIILRHTPER